MQKNAESQYSFNVSAMCMEVRVAESLELIIFPKEAHNVQTLDTARKSRV